MPDETMPGQTTPGETIGSFLDRLSARVPAPGGGATAALHAAQAAALLAMVARYSDGPKYEAHAETISGVVLQADQLRGDSLALADADAEAFGTVAAAYALQTDTDDQKAARSAAIATALITAAAPPARVIANCAQLLDLAETLLPIGNRSVITDVAAAAEAIRAGVATSRINVEVNLSGITDDAARATYETALGLVDGLIVRADQISLAVRREIYQ